MGAIASITGILGQGIADTVMYRPQISTLWWMGDRDRGQLLPGLE
jgi:putative inorganic carbon (HCO3(-)) transporter